MHEVADDVTRGAFADLDRAVEIEAIDAGAAGDIVLADPAYQQVVAGSAIQIVVAGFPIKPVVPGAATKSSGNHRNAAIGVPEQRRPIIVGSTVENVIPILTVEQVGARAQKVIERAVAANGDVLLFGHAHALRILTACWLGLQPRDGRLFVIGTASAGILGHERETRVISRWNVGC